MDCPHCGEENLLGAVQCMACGKSLFVPAGAAQKSDARTASHHDAARRPEPHASDPGPEPPDRKFGSESLPRCRVCLEPFDRSPRDGGWTRDAFLSARTLLSNGESGQRYSFFGSYPRLARELGRLSSRSAADRRELFRRMVFNAVIGNGDDHDRNHGMLADEERPDAFRLSPAYDLVPALHPPRIRQQALGVGDQGAWSTRENMLSSAASFDLDGTTANALIDEVEEAALDQWEQCCREHGLAPSAIAALAKCVQRIPETHREEDGPPVIPRRV